MTTVWKYSIPATDYFVVDMPEGAYPLWVQLQGGEPCMWARVDPGRPSVKRRFRVAGTGHHLNEDVGRHVGSFQLHGGSLVFHVFEAESRK